MSEYTDTAAGVSATGDRASFGRRLVAIIVDGIILGVIGAIIGAVLSDAENLANALGIAVGLAYFTYLEGSTGQTLGKRLLGIRVEDVRGGGPIGFGRAAIRYVGRIVSTLPLLLGYLWMLWDGEKQTWHDKFASSVVNSA